MQNEAEALLAAEGEVALPSAPLDSILAPNPPSISAGGTAPPAPRDPPQDPPRNPPRPTF